MYLILLISTQKVEGITFANLVNIDYKLVNQVNSNTLNLFINSLYLHLLVFIGRRLLELFPDVSPARVISIFRGMICLVSL